MMLTRHANASRYWFWITLFCHPLPQEIAPCRREFVKLHVSANTVVYNHIPRLRIETHTRANHGAPPPKGMQQDVAQCVLFYYGRTYCTLSAYIVSVDILVRIEVRCLETPMFGTFVFAIHLQKKGEMTFTECSPKPV